MQYADNKSPEPVGSGTQISSSSLTPRQVQRAVPGPGLQPEPTQRRQSSCSSWRGLYHHPHCHFPGCECLWRDPTLQSFCRVCEERLTVRRDEAISSLSGVLAGEEIASPLATARARNDILPVTFLLRNRTSQVLYSLFNSCIVSVEGVSSCSVGRPFVADRSDSFGPVPKTLFSPGGLLPRITNKIRV